MVWLLHHPSLFTMWSHNTSTPTCTYDYVVNIIVMQGCPTCLYGSVVILSLSFYYVLLMLCTCAFLNCAISSYYSIPLPFIINLPSLYLPLIFCPLPPPPSSFSISSSSLLFSASSTSSHILLLLFHLFFLYSFSYNLTEVQSKVDSKIGLLTHVHVCIHTQADRFVYILISTFSSTNSMSSINIHSCS